MKLKEIAAISGKPGLYKIVKPTYNGVIVESLDEKKKKMAVSAAHRVSILQEVSIYTTDKEGALALEEVFHRIYEQYKDGVPLSGKSSRDELDEFMDDIVPNYDRERVFVSDMKKLINWFNILHRMSPETLETLLEEEEEEAKEETKPDAEVEAKTEKPKTEEISEGEAEAEVKPSKAKKTSTNKKSTSEAEVAQAEGEDVKKKPTRRRKKKTTEEGSEVKSEEAPKAKKKASPKKTTEAKAEGSPKTTSKKTATKAKKASE